MLGIAVALCGMLAPATLPAEQAPVPQDELERDSDLIVEADVLSITKVERNGFPAWCAHLRIHKTIKGCVDSNPMTYWFVPPEPGVLGSRNESVFAGERVRLYLVRENNRFVAWASNSIETLDHFSQERRVLPDRVGEAILADGTRTIVRNFTSCR